MPQAMTRLHAAAEPRRQELIRRMNMAPAGTRQLVRMREELLAAMKERSVSWRRWTPTSGTCSRRGSTAASWCCSGSTGRRRRTCWRRSSATRPCTRSTSWDDLRLRLEPPDRRCFAFFHPALSGEPLIFVEVALTRERARGDRAAARRAIAAAVAAEAREHRRLLFDLELPGGTARDLLRQLPDQAGRRGPEARAARA